MKIKKTVTALCTLTAALLCGCGSAPASLPLDSPDISGNSGESSVRGFFCVKLLKILYLT